MLATASGLIFQGRGEIVGELLVLRADTGATLWRYKTPSLVMAPPVSYSIDDEQYIAVISGAGGPVIFGAATEAKARQFGRVLAFKLNGTAGPLPEPQPAPPPNPPAEEFSAAAITAGKELYSSYCGSCHGLDIRRASNIIPDLRRSGMLGSADAWRAVVIDGVLTANGMIGWSERLTPEQAETVRAYVGEEAKLLQRMLRAESK